MTTTPTTPATGPIVIYDGDCPLSAAYMRKVRLRNAVGPVTLVNAREASHPALDRTEREGIDLSRGIVVVLGGKLFHGSKSMTILAALVAPVDPLNRAVSWAFRSPRRATFLHPTALAGRDLTLRLSGRA